jgi:hypothetical protein
MDHLGTTNKAGGEIKHETTYGSSNTAFDHCVRYGDDFRRSVFSPAFHISKNERNGSTYHTINEKENGSTVYHTLHMAPILVTV